MTSSGFAVQLTREAEKDLKRLRPYTDRAVQAIHRLENDPFLGHPLTGSLRGARSLEFSLPGSGVYRAVYIVHDDERICLVFIVGSHENICGLMVRKAEAVKR
jgi:addiction module RelE/StbE family toxin